MANGSKNEPSPATVGHPPDCEGHTRQLLDYWLSKARPRTPPLKSEIEPWDIKPLLPHLIIYERRASDDFFIRLMGSTVTQRIGRSGTGRNALDFIAEPSRSMVRDTLNRILDEPVGHLSVVRDVYPTGREERVEVLRLPLRDADERNAFIVSATRPLEVLQYGERTEAPALLAEPLESTFFAW